MTQRARLLLIAGLAAALAACKPAPDKAQPPASAAPPAARPAPTPEPSQTPPPAPEVQPLPPGSPGALPDDRRPLPEGRIDPDSAQGAAKVAQTYFALVESRRYAEAQRLWGPGSYERNQPPKAFAEPFRAYDSFHALIGAPSGIEGAAGSLFVEVPVQAYGRLKDGREVHRLGSAVLRRSNDVPGSTPEQRAWRLHEVRLDEVRPPARR